MARIVWTREALADIEQIRVYVAQFDPAAAQRIAGRLIEAGNSLKAFPNRGRPASHGRRELVTVPPYLLRYVVRDEAVFIVGVRHGRQRPD